MVDVDESHAQDETVTPGKLLLAGRQQAGLSREQVAKELYMTVSKVTALEVDDYGRLISDTFARGYIRAYASLLKLDVPQILAAYDALIGEETALVTQSVQAAQPAKKAGESGQRGAWQFLVIIVAFLVGLWLISVWFFDNHTDKQEETRYLVPSPSISPVVISAEDAARMQAAASAAAVASTLTSGLTTVSASSASSSVAAPSVAIVAASKSLAASSVSSGGAVGKAVVTSIAAASTAGAVASSVATSQASSSASAIKKATLDEISFSFSAESWLEVSDSRGDVLATELQPKGSKIKLIGQAPFDVKLGNAPAADIQFNGKKVDVIPLLGTNVLIMKVGN